MSGAGSSNAIGFRSSFLMRYRRRDVEQVFQQDAPPGGPVG
jgi:hypothetical protein